MKRIELQAGFVEFCRQNFQEATAHFNNGGLDPREVCNNDDNIIFNSFLRLINYYI